MTDAEAYREIAEMCAAFAGRARSPQDRRAWLLMSSAWRELAVMREYAVRQPLNPIDLPSFLKVRRTVTAVRR